MTPHTRRRPALTTSLALSLLALLSGRYDVLAIPRPGDVFGDYAWRAGPTDHSWQRVTGPDAAAEGAAHFLPNAVNEIAIEDLDRAVRCEVTIEQWGGHAGTGHKQMRVNGHDWLDVPEPAGIPGESGRGGPSINYQYFAYPTVVVRTEQLNEGGNTFEFVCSSGRDLDGLGLGDWWPQWGLYGVTFRVYYAPEKAETTGRIIQPKAGAELGQTVEVVVEADGAERVELLARYVGFDDDGDGIFGEWHHRYRYGRLVGHVGTVEPGTALVWDTSGIPDQDGALALVAWVRSGDGLTTVTPIVDGLALSRPQSVRMFVPTGIPPQWQTRAGGRQSCVWYIDGDLTLATEAWVVLTTWNGDHCEELAVNGRMLAPKVGKNHNYSYDVLRVPVEMLTPGENTVSTFSSTQHHGIEVMWPGPVLFVRCRRPR